MEKHCHPFPLTECWKNNKISTNWNQIPDNKSSKTTAEIVGNIVITIKVMCNKITNYMCLNRQNSQDEIGENATTYL